MLGKISAISACPVAMTTYVISKVVTSSYAMSASGAARCVSLQDALSILPVTTVNSILLWRQMICNKKKRMRKTKSLLMFLRKTRTKVNS